MLGGMTLTDERAPAPSPALRPWVSEVHGATFSPHATRRIARLPSGASSFVLCKPENGSVAVLAIGPNTAASYKPAQAVPLYRRFVLRPGSARSLFGVALHELVDGAVPVEALWGKSGAELRDRLARMESEPDAAARMLERALLERLDARRGGAAPSGLLGRAVQALEVGGAEPRQIHALARSLRVSERKLRDLFRDEIGISPKKYERIARLRRALSRAGSVGWARLAAETGYYDQSHLTAEFRDLLGVTPRAFASNVPLGATCSTALRA